MVKIVKDIREFQAKVGLNLVATYVVMLVVGMVILSLANWLFPSVVVLGTATISPMWAVCLASGKLALISTAVMPLVTYKEWKMKRNYTPRDWMITYFIVDVIAIWLIARAATHLGLGISSWWVAVVLGGVLDWVQGMAMIGYGKVTGQQPTK